MGRFIDIMQKAVLERLNFVTGYSYQQHIDVVVNQSGSLEEIAASENVVMGLMKDWGEVIIGGDLLTVERYDQNISLRSSNLTEFSRGSFLGPSRIAVFHFRQNMQLKIIAAMLPNMLDSSNPGSLNAFRALTDKAKDLSNQERKIKDNFELHYQFLMNISEVYLEEKVVSFFHRKYGATDGANLKEILKMLSGMESESLLQEILQDSSHTVFFQQGRTLEIYEKGADIDDLVQTGNFFVSVWFQFKCLEFIIKTGDPDGIQYFKKNAILLFLSLHSSASKYVHKGFHELIKQKCMSDRMKLRFNAGSFVKFHDMRNSGSSIRPGNLNCRSEDMVCEWLVEDVKNSLKSMGGNYSEETVDKKIRAMPLVNSLLDADDMSLAIEKRGPGSSWSRFDDEELGRFRKYVQKLDPFRCSPQFHSIDLVFCRMTDRKAVVYSDKSLVRSLYSTLSPEFIGRFFDMKLSNLK